MNFKEDEYEPKRDLYCLGLLIDIVAETFHKDKSSLEKIKQKLFGYKYRNVDTLLSEMLSINS